jgi:hypothetical protein
MVKGQLRKGILIDGLHVDCLDVFGGSGLSLGSLFVEDVVHGFDFSTVGFQLSGLILSGAVHDVTYHQISLIFYLLGQIMGNRLFLSLLNDKVLFFLAR